MRLGLARRGKSLQTTRVTLRKKQSCVDTVIACSPLPHSRNPAWLMAPPLLKHQESTLFNKFSESEHASSTQALPQRKSSGDQNVPQLKASADQNVPQHQKATFEIMKWFMKAIIFTKTSWPILSDGQYSTVAGAWKLAIEAHDRQRALPGAPVGTPSVCQLPGGPSFKIDPPTREAVSLGSCVMILIRIRILTTPYNIHSWNWRYVPFEDTWQRGHIELLSVVTSWICALSLSFGSWLRSYCSTMHISPRLLMIKNHCSPEWNCLIWFTTNFCSPPIAWGTSLRHPSFSNLSLRSLYHEHLQLFIVHSLNMPVDRRPQIYFLKMNIEVHFAHPLR